MTGQVNVVNDVGTLLRIPNKTLDELIEKTNLCIGSIIHDAKLNNEEVVVINIGIGTLSISLADMQCKFLPSKDLKSSIKRILAEGTDSLEYILEDAIVEKLIAACEEVL